jgi:hypothetical protein
MYSVPNLNVREVFTVYYNPQISELSHILLTFLILR